MEYLIEFEGKQFSPNGMLDEPVNIEDHNKELERQELEYWATKPDRWHCYVHPSKPEVTSFTGAILGRIVKRTTYRSNIARHITAITVQGDNGATYYGRFGSDWSQLCRLRKAKGK